MTPGQRRQRVAGTANENDCDICRALSGHDCYAGCDCDVCQLVLA